LAQNNTSSEREIIMGVAKPQKTLVAAAVAAACAAPALALAQVPAGVQIYGRVNVSYEYITIDPPLVPGDKKSSWELVDNSSRIGVRGRKDLGGGLAGFFQIESRVRLDEGGDTLSSRDSYAGLQSGWGTIRAGRTIGPVYYATYDYISMHNHDTGTSSDALLAPTVVGNTTGFMNNTLWYTSPKFGAITVDVAFSRLAETNIPGQEQPSHLGLVGSYDQGPLHVSASYANTKKTVVVGTGTNDDKAYTVGGLYDMKTFVVGALFESAESKLVTDKAKRNYFRVAVMMPVGKQEFHVNWGNVNHRLDAKLSNDGADQLTLGYNYNITKETKVYGFFTQVTNDPSGNYGFRPSPDGADNKSIAVGVRHNF
jgi:predicted porin